MGKEMVSLKAGVKGYVMVLMKDYQLVFGKAEWTVSLKVLWMVCGLADWKGLGMFFCLVPMKA